MGRDMRMEREGKLTEDLSFKVFFCRHQTHAKRSARQRNMFIYLRMIDCIAIAVTTTAVATTALLLISNFEIVAA